MRGIGGEVVLSLVAAVEKVGEGQGGGSGAEKGTGGEVEREIEGVQAVDAVEPRVDLGGFGVVFDLEEDDVLDEGRR